NWSRIMLAVLAAQFASVSAESSIRAPVASSYQVILGPAGSAFRIGSSRASVRVVTITSFSKMSVDAARTGGARIDGGCRRGGRGGRSGRAQTCGGGRSVRRPGIGRRTGARVIAGEHDTHGPLGQRR